jgi:hypothetical protein
MEFHLSAQSKNTGPATSCVGASPRELNIGFVVRQAMPRLSLVRSLPADIGGSKRVCRTVGASYASYFWRRCMGAHGWSQRMTAATHPARPGVLRRYSNAETQTQSWCQPQCESARSPELTDLGGGLYFAK